MTAPPPVLVLSPPGRCCFVPPHLLRHLAETDEPVLVELAERMLRRDADLRARRASTGAGPRRASGATGGPAWQVHDAGGTETLPGELVRSPGDPDTGDPAVDEAALGLEATQSLLSDWGRSSYDGEGATAVATVHFGQDYANAFWDGTQLVFGDGDGLLFGRFTEPVDVLGHELAHALTQHTAGLVYSHQSGALNESMSDVVGSCVKQRLAGEDAADADWLIGEGIFVAGVQGVALRSMAAPGTAYDDPRLGRDPQPGHMDDYVTTAEDNGGVHINSGIANKAFQLAATAIGGTSWEGAGRIWFAALTSGIPATSDFARFAAATVAAAGAHEATVTAAWQQVGVTPDADSAPGPGGPVAGDARTVAVTRSGGFAGLVQRGTVDLDADDPRAGEVAALLERIDFTALERRARAEHTTGPAGADRFVYEFDCAGVRLQASEALLDDDARRLAAIVLNS